MKTHNEFSLATTEQRYRDSLDLPLTSPYRSLAAFEYIAALEEALHGVTPNPFVARAMAQVDAMRVAS